MECEFFGMEKVLKKYGIRNLKKSGNPVRAVPVKTVGGQSADAPTFNFFSDTPGSLLITVIFFI